MIVGGILDAVAGITKIVTDRIAERRYEWARFAAEEPGPAALLLDRTAAELEGTVAAMRPKRRTRWVARRRMAKAAALRELADDIRRLARHETCQANPLRRPC